MIIEEAKEKLFDAYDKIGDILQGMSVLEATFVLGVLVADQAKDDEEASDICALILSSAINCMNSPDDVANTLPV